MFRMIYVSDKGKSSSCKCKVQLKEPTYFKITKVYTDVCIDSQAQMVQANYYPVLKVSKIVHFKRNDIDTEDE